ncbi:MAG TPA: ABC transporter permease subunit, partial [Pseudogracilibacillus sp.]|nr:ABC transporter permease subunit [Pseudogracilibacillus sp.]
MDDNRIFPKIPLDEWVEQFRDFLKDNIQPFFDTIRDVIEEVDEAFRWVLSIGDIPYSPFILMIIITIIGFFVSGWKMGLFSLVGLWLINNLGYWDHLLDTLSLVVISVLIAIIIGVPIGIWMSQKDLAQMIITPILDFMQTMPAFVYLIPAVVFFKLGVVPGVVSTVIFSMPPTVRLTNLGIRQVDAELVEAADAFGSTTWQ